MRRSRLGAFFKRYGWWYVPGMLFLVISVRLKTGIPQALGRAIDLLADVRIPPPGRWPEPPGIWRWAVHTRT